MKSWVKVSFAEEVYYFCPKCNYCYEFPVGETPNTANYHFCPNCSTPLCWKDTEEDLYIGGDEEEL